MSVRSGSTALLTFLMLPFAVQAPTAPATMTAIVSLGLAWGGWIVPEAVVAQTEQTEKEPAKKGTDPIAKIKEIDSNIEKPGRGANAAEKALEDMSQPKRSLRGHTDRLTSIAYSPDGESIATASWDGTARIWDAKTGKEMRQFEFSATKGYNTFGQVAFSPDNAFIVTLVRKSRDESVVIIWNRRTGEIVETFPSEAGSVALSPDGRLLACGGYQLIRLYEFATGKLVREIRGGEKQLRIQSLTFSPDGKTLISTGHPPTPERDDGIDQFTILPDVVRVWDVATGKERPSALNGRVVGHLVQHVALSKDGRTLVHPSHPKRSDITLLEAATGGVRAKLTGHKSDVCDFAFSPDGRTMASGSQDGTVRLWDLLSGNAIGRYGKEVDPYKEGGWVLAVAFSPDGRSLVSGGLNKAADIWDLNRVTVRPRVSAERSRVDLEADWKDLAGDAATAYAALGRLISSSGPTTITFLGKQLQSAKAPDNNRIELLIGNLDDVRFQVREQARKELEELHEVAGPSLEKARAGNPSLEVKRRLDALLDRLDAARPSPETVRQVRAVEALEFIGNPEARRLLETLAASPFETRLVREAKASAERLARSTVRRDNVP